MKTDKNLNKTIELIHSLLKGKQWYENWYNTPYSDSEDDHIEFKIQYRIKKVSLWKTKDGDKCLYEGTIYIEPISLSKGMNDVWVHNFKQHDIYEFCWEDLGDEIIENINVYLPQACLDYDFEFTTLNKN